MYSTSSCVDRKCASPLEPGLGHCVSRSLKEMDLRPKALAASRVSAMPVAANRPWRTKWLAMPGLQPKEKTQVLPLPLEYTASLKMFCIMSRSSVMSAHTSKPEFMKCTPRDLHSRQMVCVSMRVASSITTSPGAGAI